MDANQLGLDGWSIAPEITLWVFACIALLIEWLRPRQWKAFSAEATATTGLVIALALSILPVGGTPHLAFHDMIASDPPGCFFRSLCILSSLILIPSSWRYFSKRPNRSEFCALLLLATSGMTLLVASMDLVMLFLSLEFLSITSYVLVGYLKGSRRSTEAAVKYFLFGSICSALMLYGMSLIYGITGSTNFHFIQNHPPSLPIGSGLEVLMVVTFFAGIGFKISMWPFHMWAPDAYEGAPTPVTAFLSVGPKIAGIAVFVRVAQTMFHGQEVWPLVLEIVAIITMTWGNLAALGQSNVKRMLAYSSIAQAGYLLVGVICLDMEMKGGNVHLLSAFQNYALPSVLIYSLAYLVMNLGAFIVTIEVERVAGTSEISGFAGLAERSPGLAAAMTIFLLGLAGIPLTAGFIGKLYLFGSAVAWATYGGSSATILWLVAGVGVGTSVISVYYYFRVVQPIWLGAATETGRTFEGGAPERVAGLLAILTLALGIFGQLLVRPATMMDDILTTRAPQVGRPSAIIAEVPVVARQ